MPLLSLTNKGKTLEDLVSLTQHSKTLPVLRIRVCDVRDDIESVISTIQQGLDGPSLAVRSSARAEDNLTTSNAGHFRSVLDVPKDDRGAVGKALEAVVSSYGACAADEELFVQPMLQEIAAAGVAFTADADTLAPYYIINYDESGRSDTITSGEAGYVKTYVHFKHSPIPPPDVVLRSICAACRELEELSGNDCLDVEFAVSRGDVYVLQVRPITRQGKEDFSRLDLADALFKIHRKVEKLSAPNPSLLGSKALFGVMPDWNPAEIIGMRPRQLALSLYKELVTDNIWAYQRDNYGYRNLRSHPLLVSYLGMPFIDVRVDFNSFVPKALDEQIAAKLVDYYIDKLDSSPELHDKVEFEIVHSCYYLTLPEKLDNLLQHGFNANELKRIEFALLELTNGIVSPEQGLYKRDLQRVNELVTKQSTIISSDLNEIEKVYWLVEYCKRYGTLPFAGVARAAFIAVQFLASFVEAGIMTAEERGRLLASLNTVTKKLQVKLCRLASGEESLEEFLAEFGHLRPGTYDILSPCYAENFERYFPALPDMSCLDVSYEFSADQKSCIDRLARENGLQTDAEGLLRFIVEAIEGREYAKLVFTRTLNDILRLIGEVGEKYGIARDDMSYLDIRTLLNLYSSLDHRNLMDILSADISVHRSLHSYTKAVKLPSLIRNPADVYGFFLEPETPNFVTMQRVVAETADEAQVSVESVTGKIVFIRAADPGYDFLLTRNIAGLVTQFGGANSHMAIRCAEQKIPAVIGAGEKNFSHWSKAISLEIDCAGRQVRVLS